MAKTVNVKLPADWQNLRAIVDRLTSVVVGCFVSMSACDEDVDIFNGVLTGGTVVVAPADVIPGNTVPA